MKQFFIFVKKEFFHIVRDGRTMLILLGMPIVQILLFGFAISVDVKNVRTAVFNPSQDELSRRVVERISHNPYFTVVGEARSVEEADALLRQGKIDLAVIFPPLFEYDAVHSKRAQVQIMTDASNPNIGTISENYATAVIAQYQQELAGRRPVAYQIETGTRMLFNPAMESAYMFVPGIMGLVLMIICAMMTSISIVREKERGTMEVLLASPLKMPSILAAKAVPYLGLSVINLISILLLSYFVLHVPIRGNLLVLLSVSTLFIFMALSLGLFISTVVQTQQTAIMISGIGLMMPTIILSGMLFSIENMPLPLQWLSCMVPARWFIAAVKKIMIEGFGAASILKETGILAGMAFLFVAASIKNIKNRLG